jgi:hypothetical protein
MEKYLHYYKKYNEDDCYYCTKAIPQEFETVLFLPYMFIYFSQLSDTLKLFAKLLMKR